MDAAEEEQASRPGPLLKLELVEVDAVMHGRHVVELRAAIGVADRHVVTRRVVLLVHRQDARRGEAVDGRHHGRVDETAVGERQEVEVVVDQIELVGPLEHLRDVQALPDLGVQAVILGVRARAGPGEHGLRDRVGRGEQRDVHAARDQALGQERDDALPRSVVPRRDAPGDRREHGDANGGLSARPRWRSCRG